MSTIGIARKLVQTSDNTSAERIQMQIPDQLQKVGRFLTHNRLVAIVKEVSTPTMPPVKGPGVARQQGTHSPRQGAFIRTYEQMQVVWQ